MEVEFDVKWGRNRLIIPTAKYARLSRKPWGTDLFNKTVTLYNDIPADDVNPRVWKRTVLKDCNVQGGLMEKANGTVANIVNAKTITVMDIDNYLPPTEFYALPADVRADYFTVNTGDFIIFEEVDREITTSREWSTLQSDYSNNGIKVMTVSENIYGTSADNISISNIG